LIQMLRLTKHCASRYPRRRRELRLRQESAESSSSEQSAARQGFVFARFADVATRYDAVQPILGELRRATNVEEVLEKLIKERDQYPSRTRQLLGATYYIRQVIHRAQYSWWQGAVDRVTNYIELVEQIDRWTVDSRDHVAFVTFNYDTLLEKAIHAVTGKEFRQVDDYVTHPMPVFKLHGSIDWWQGVANLGWSGNLALAWADQMIAAAKDIRPTGAFQVREPDQGTGGPVIPAISLPVLTKGDEAFACPATHLEALRAALPTATKVLVIGWRGAEAHFYSLWKASFKPSDHKPYSVLMVGSEDGVHEAWNTVKASAHWLPYGTLFKGGFSSLIGSDALSMFLEETVPSF
jgi:CRISPR/Cas system-associated endoribonuclease Cas2